MDTVIETRGLTKRYGGDVCALYDADVSVRRGDIFGVVGDNGAGKTTLFKLLCGLAFPTEGEVRLFGRTSRASWSASARASAPSSRAPASIRV